MNAAEIWQKIKPHAVRDLLTSNGGGGSVPGGLTAHALNGPFHTGQLAESQATWALPKTTFDAHTGNPNAHHSRQHDIVSASDHTITGAALSLVGATATNTLGVITPSANPGGTEAVLKATGGLLTLPNITLTTKVTTPHAGSPSTFNTGFTGSGYRLDDGLATAGKTTIEIDEMIVRGRMRVYELLIHQIRATNGSVFVTGVGKAKTVTGTGPYTITTETDHGFAANDLIRAQRFTGTGVYQCNMLVTSVATTLQFTATLSSGDAPAAGMEFVRLGNTTDTTRQGSIYLTADDTFAPAIDILDGVTSFAEWGAASKIKVRLGKLTTALDANLLPSGYGLYAPNAYLSGDLLTGAGAIRIYNASGINIAQDTWGSWDNKRALQWWPDVASMSGSPSLSIYTGKAVGGFTDQQNFSYIDANPTGGKLAGLSLTAFGQGTGGLAAIYLEGGSQALSTSPSVTFTATTIDLVGAIVLDGTTSARQLNPQSDLGFSLGSALLRWNTLYVNQIVANSISGTTMNGAEWEYAGNMVIDANSSSANTTISVVNQGAGAWVANLAVEGSITSAGVAVSLAGHTHNDYLLATGATVGATSQAQEFANGAILVAPDATSSQLLLRSARAALAVTNVVGGIDFQSNDTSLTAPGTVTARIQALTTAAHTAAQLGTDIVFYASTGTTLLSEALRVKEAGIAVPRIGLGTVNPSSARLINVDETYTTDATNYGIYQSVTADGAITTTRNTYGAQILTYNARDSIKTAGFSNTIYGVNVVTYNQDGMTASSLYGNNGQVINQGSGSIVQAFGSLNQVLNQSTGSITTVMAMSGDAENTGGGAVTTSTAVRGYLYSANGTVTTGYGVYSWVRANGASAVHTDTYAYYARQDRDNGTSTNAYLYYGVFEGTHTLKRGLWLVGETENSVSGKLMIGGDLELTGELLVANGTVGAPSIAALTDTNTGLYWSAADVLAVTTGGVQRATFSSAGLALPTGKINATAIDQGHILDTALVGTVPGASNWAGFSHKDRSNVTDFALLHTDGGDTLLNGKTVTAHYINGAEVWRTGSFGLQSSNYASQTTGWRISSPSGAADFRYLFTTEMHAKSFIADLQMALAGGQIITPSVAELYSTFTCPDYSASTTLTVRDLPSAAGMQVFPNSTIVRVANFNRSGGSMTISAAWGTVTLDTTYGVNGFDSATKSQRYTFTRQAVLYGGSMAAGDTVAADTIILCYGVSGNGYIETTTVDGLYGANSPYVQIATWAVHPAFPQVRSRWGNLAGLSIADFGLVMGTDVGAAATRTFDFRASTGNLALGANGGAIMFQGDGSSYFSGAMTIGSAGGIYQGSGTFASPTTGLKIWNDTGTGRIGGYNAGTLQWYANTDGKLYAGGGNALLDSNGISVIGAATLRIMENASTLKGYLYSSNPLDSLLVNTTGVGIKTNGSATTESISLRANASGGRTSEIAIEGTGSDNTNRVRLYAYSGNAETSSLLTLSETIFSVAVKNSEQIFSINGDTIIFIKNGSTPGSNPTGGGYMFVDNGALKWRGSSGTVTTIANA